MPRTKVHTLVTLLEHAIILYPVDGALAVVERIFSLPLGVDESPPFSGGLTLELRRKTLLIIRALDLEHLIDAPVSPIRKAPPSSKLDYCFAWGVVVPGAKCSMQPVDFIMVGDRLEGELPPSHDRTWPSEANASHLYHIRAVALREIRERAPVRLGDIPAWAQRELTPEERLHISQHMRLP